MSFANELWMLLIAFFGIVCGWAAVQGLSDQ
jgi:hypothetical protein